ncbi:COMM domain-containing protein 10 isoform X1 [Micropterus salmoides]|uniref:COMM domain-containing protein 10 isoform X1 n=1 Tax=Micropterus salmoides TaxID=27706 RepID=UPI0018ED64E9|nr:COMM domain-containing protein 10 isoform X1 [Micropterus salmoides]
MTSIIKETQSIKEAVIFINAIDVNKFSRLISRIIQKLHLKGERTFSEEEEQKLQAALSLDKQALNLVLETVAFILEQAVYHNVKPASLQQQLEAVQLNPDKAEMFSQTWATAGPELVERLKHNIFAPKKLEYVGWQLNLQMAQSSQARLQSPSAVLQLGLRNEDSEMVIPLVSVLTQRQPYIWLQSNCSVKTRDQGACYLKPPRSLCSLERLTRIGQHSFNCIHLCTVSRLVYNMF